MLKGQKFSIDVNGKPLTLEVSELAKQANAAVLGQYGETVVLATVVMTPKDKDANFFPLVVDYEERFYAAGKIIGSRFVRREGRPSEEAILSARLIDRTIRPLFDHRIRRGVQLVITILSFDEENDPDFVAMMAGSLALAISDIPWNGPVAGIKLASFNNEVEINPLLSKTKEGGDFEAFVAGPYNHINMVELGGNQIKESLAEKTFEIAQKEINRLIEWQKDIVKKIGKPKTNLGIADIKPEVKTKAEEFLGNKLEKIIYQPSKTERQSQLEELNEKLVEFINQTETDEKVLASVAEFFESEVDRLVHKNIIEAEKRPDGRKLDEIRPLTAEAGLFERTHGSALFVRGDTQALSLTTLAPPGSELLIETMETSGKKHFMHHYNFPAYSVGETGPYRGPGRREIGHGALAGKALKAVVPSLDEFPYTIRVVSETLSSNGSSSMASTCAGSLSLMDAGVPIKKPVGGIAMGLMSESDEKYKILTDIQGPEDHYGDMDFKIAGTDEGITAMQLDVKVNGLTLKIIRETMEQAKKARLQILEVMKKVISQPKESLSKYAPAILTFQIDPERIGEVIGPGGKVINGIIASTGGKTTIDIEENGKIFVSGPTKELAEAALNQIKSIVKTYTIGEIVEGKVVRIMDFGAIVEFDNRDGMVHVSELKNGFVKKVEDVVKLGDKVKAKIIRLDPDGRIGLSLKI